MVFSQTGAPSLIIITVSMPNGTVALISYNPSTGFGSGTAKDKDGNIILTMEFTPTGWTILDENGNIVEHN